MKTYHGTIELPAYATREMDSDEWDGQVLTLSVEIMDIEDAGTLADAVISVRDEVTGEVFLLDDGKYGEAFPELVDYVVKKTNKPMFRERLAGWAREVYEQAKR